VADNSLAGDTQLQLKYDNGASSKATFVHCLSQPSLVPVEGYKIELDLTAII
jgi:hypothetical protein